MISIITIIIIIIIILIIIIIVIILDFIYSEFSTTQWCSNALYVKKNLENFN